MAIHLPSGAEGFVFEAGVGIQLGKELLNCCQSACKHKGLVAVVARTEITGLEKFSHSHLCYFLAIAENAKLGFAGQHFLSSQQAGLPADANPAVVCQNFIPETVK